MRPRCQVPYENVRSKKPLFYRCFRFPRFSLHPLTYQGLKLSFERVTGWVELFQSVAGRVALVGTTLAHIVRRRWMITTVTDVCRCILRRYTLSLTRVTGWVSESFLIEARVDGPVFAPCEHCASNWHGILPHSVPHQGLGRCKCIKTGASLDPIEKRGDTPPGISPHVVLVPLFPHLGGSGLEGVQ